MAPTWGHIKTGWCCKSDIAGFLRRIGLWTKPALVCQSRIAGFHAPVCKQIYCKKGGYKRDDVQYEKKHLVPCGLVFMKKNKIYYKRKPQSKIYIYCNKVYFSVGFFSVIKRYRMRCPQCSKNYNAGYGRRFSENKNCSWQKKQKVHVIKSGNIWQPLREARYKKINFHFLPYPMHRVFL